MGAVGAVGGVGGGLGSVGDGGTSFDAGAASDAAAASSSSWFNAAAVMSTSGDVDQGSVRLGDADLSSQYLLDERQLGGIPSQQSSGSADASQGVGDKPSAEVVDRVASVYAAQTQSKGLSEMVAW